MIVAGGAGVVGADGVLGAAALDPLLVAETETGTATPFTMVVSDASPSLSITSVTPSESFSPGSAE
jgi:hypothetical protein